VFDHLLGGGRRAKVTKEAKFNKRVSQNGKTRNVNEYSGKKKQRERGKKEVIERKADPRQHMDQRAERKRKIASWWRGPHRRGKSHSDNGAKSQQRSMKQAWDASAETFTTRGHQICLEKKENARVL